MIFSNKQIKHLPKSWASMLALASGNMVISTGGAHLSSSTSVPDMFPVFKNF